MPALKDLALALLVSGEKVERPAWVVLLILAAPGAVMTAIAVCAALFFY